MYELTENEIKRISDGACIPKDEANNDYAEYLKWIAAGNTPAPYVPPAIPVEVLRQAEYPPIGDVIDELLKVMETGGMIPAGSGLEVIQQKRNAVKAKHPKKPVI